MIQINHRTSGGIAVLDLDGKLLADPENRLWTAMQDLVVEQGKRQVLLDFSKIQVCDSYGIGELLRLHAALDNMSGKLVLFSVSPLISKLFGITQVDQVLHIAQNEHDAVKRLQPVVMVD